MRADDQDLPFRITFESRPDYLYAYVEGEKDSYEVSIAYWKLAAAEARKADCRKILVDENIAGIVSMADMYRVASEMPPLLTGLTVAFVDRHADQSGLNQFGEMVAQNRGVRGRFFVNLAAAESWLLSQ